MPEYLAPGVYVEEIERGPKPIEGVATSTAAFLGATERGPQPAAAGHQLQRVPPLLRRHLRRRRRTCRTPCKTFFDNGGRRGLHRPHQRRQRRRARPSTSPGSPSRPSGVGDGLQPGVGPHRPGHHQGRRRQPGRVPAAGLVLGQGRPRRPVRPRRRSPPGDPAGPEPIGDRGLRRPERRSGLAVVLRQAGQRPQLRRSVGDRRRRVREARRRPCPAARQSAPLGRTAPTATRSPLPTSSVTTPDPNERTGLAALDLDRYRDVAIVHAPGAEPRRRAGRHHPLRAQPVPLRRRRRAARRRRNSATIDPRTDLARQPVRARSTTRGSSSATRAAAPARRSRRAARSAASTP